MSLAVCFNDYLLFPSRAAPFLLILRHDRYVGDNLVALYWCTNQPNEILDSNAGLLARRLLLTGYRTTAAFTRASVCFGALTTNRQTTPVPQSAVATDVHQPLDVHLHFTAQRPFNDILVFDQLTDLLRLVFRPFARLLVRINTQTGQNFNSSRSTNTEYRRQRNFSALVIRYVNS